MRRQKRAFIWPYHQDARRQRGVERMSRARSQLDALLHDVAHGKIEKVEVRALHLRVLVTDTERELIEAKDGEPDDLRLALDIIRDLRAGRPAENRADALLERYEEIEL